MKIHVVNIYLGLCCLYSLQGTLYASGGIISQAILAIVLVWSLYYFLVANLNFKLPKVMKVLSILILIWIVYGLVRIIYGPVASWIPSYYYLKNILFSLLPIYAFYVFTKRGLLTERILLGWFYVFIIIGITSFFRAQREITARTMQDEATNNAGYTILSLICLLPLLRRKPLFQYVVLAVLLFFVLQGFKRGAILIGVLCSVFFLYETYRSNRQSGGKVSGRQVMRILFTIGVVITVIYFVQQTLITSDYFNQRLEDTMEGKSSMRDEIFSTLYTLFITQDSPFSFLFGNGADATVKLAGYYAHNDWLEIAINNGLWMVVLYAIYWIAMLRHIIRIRKHNSLAYMMVGLFFILYFMKTLFSMSYSSVPFYAASALGFALAIGEQPMEEIKL